MVIRQTAALKAEIMAEKVGAQYGRVLATGLSGEDLEHGQRSLKSALQAVADALTAHGFAAHTDHRRNLFRQPPPRKR